MHRKLTSLTVLAVMLSTAAAWAYTWEGIDFHGILDQGYMVSDANNFLGNTKDGTFHMTEATLNASKQLNDKLRVGMQLYTSRIGDIGGISMPEIDWMYADYQVNNNIGFRVGKIKIPNGLYGENVGVDMARTSVFLPQSVYSPYWRDFAGGMWGVGTYGNIPLSKSFGSVDYNIVFGKLDIRSHSGTSYEVDGTSPENDTKNKNDFSVIGQAIWNTPAQGLRIASSIWYAHDVQFDGTFQTAAELGELPLPLSGLTALAPYLTGSHMTAMMPDITLITLGPEYVWKEWTFAAEYSRQQAMISNTVDSPYAGLAPGGSLTGTLSSYDSDGFYFSASRQITKQLQLGAYYSVYYSNSQDKKGADLTKYGIPAYEGFQKDLALSARYDITPWWMVKGEVHFMDGTGMLDNAAANPTSSQDRYWTLGVIKTTLYF